MNCPACKAPVGDGAIECGSCGIVLAKWRGTASRTPRPPTLPSTPLPPPAPDEEPPARGISLVRILVLAILGGAIVIGGYWYFFITPNRPSLKDLAAKVRMPKTIDAQAKSGDFDLAYDIPGSPGGVASNGRELILVNRKDPWGLIRLKPSGGRKMRVEPIALIEPVYQQKMSLYTIAWDGRRYVGYTTASWFGQSTGHVFTIHDPVTLEIKEHKPAPDLIGCLTWDGTGYWAATRRNTADSPEPKLLYRLDRDLNVVLTSESPSVGCQGLAFQKGQLWMADVFDDAIYVVDVTQGEPKLVYTAPTNISYLSGVALYDRELWVTDYGDDQLRRMRPTSRIAWSGGRAASAEEAESIAASMMSTGQSPATPADGPSSDELRRQLRSESWSERMRAEMELDNRQEIVDFDRKQNNFFERKSDECDEMDWQIELRDDAIWGSWKIWFGPELLERGRTQSSVVTIPELARYEFTIKMPSGEEVKREFDAVAGENVMQGVRLADAREPGEYSVSLFLHVQYVARDGTAKILNNSVGGLELRK